MQQSVPLLCYALLCFAEQAEQAKLRKLLASTLNTPLYLTANLISIALAQQLFYVAKHEQLFLICKKTRKSKARTHSLRSKAIPALLGFPAKLD